MSENNQATAPQQPYPPQTPTAKPKKPAYKKWWFWVLIVIALFIILGIATSENESPVEPSGQTVAAAVPTQSKKTTERTTKAPATTMTSATTQVKNIGKVKITALEVKKKKGTSGNVYVGIKFEAENVSGEDQAVATLGIFEAFVDGTYTRYDTNAMIALGGVPPFGVTLSSSQKAIGWSCVQVPENWNKIEVRVKGGAWGGGDTTFTFSK